MLEILKNSAFLGSVVIIVASGNYDGYMNTLDLSGFLDLKGVWKERERRVYILPCTLFSL